MNIFYFFLFIVCMVLIGVKAFKKRRKQAVPSKKVLFLENKKIKNRDIVFSNEIKKIKCKEIIKK